MELDAVLTGLGEHAVIETDDCSEHSLLDDAVRLLKRSMPVPTEFARIRSRLAFMDNQRPFLSAVVGDDFEPLASVSPSAPRSTEPFSCLTPSPS